jgi:hypothetical protein
MFWALMISWAVMLFGGFVLGYVIGEYRGMFPTRRER